MSWPWSQLGLPGPSDLSEVRHAYAEKLKTTHPEDDPEGFQRLHSAYQLASRMARQRKRTGTAPEPRTEDPPPPRPREGFDFDRLLEDGEEDTRTSRREDGERQDFDFERLLEEDETPPRSRPEEEQDWDYERLFAEGEAERAEARRRRGEERRRDQERWEEQLSRQFRQKESRWQSTETILHTIEMMYNARAGVEAWEKFFQNPLFQQAKGELDLIFGLEDFVSTRHLPQEVQLTLFLAYGFDKGPSRPELQPLYQMLLPAWRAARSKKKRQWLLNILAIPVTLALIYVAAVILMSPLLIVFIGLGLVAVNGLNKGWLKRKPKSLDRGRRSGVYILCFLAVCGIAAVFLLPSLRESVQELSAAQNPREQVCRYIEQDFGEEVCSLYSESDSRFDNVFFVKDETSRMFLAGPDGERDEKNGKPGYTTNYPEMKVLWALKDFARAHDIAGIREADRGLGQWETSGTYLISLNFYGDGEIITELGTLLEEMAQEDWYQVRPPEFEIVLCSCQMEEGRLILTRYKPADGGFDAEAVRTLYEEAFAHAWCAQLLKELELDRDFLHGGEEPYTLTGGGMAEMKGEECCKLYGLRGEDGVSYEYYVNVKGTVVYCVPGDFWETGGREEQISFYRLLHWKDANNNPLGIVNLFYPWLMPSY